MIWKTLTGYSVSGILIQEGNHRTHMTFAYYLSDLFYHYLS